MRRCPAARDASTSGRIEIFLPVVSTSTCFCLSIQASILCSVTRMRMVYQRLFRTPRTGSFRCGPRPCRRGSTCPTTPPPQPPTMKLHGARRPETSAHRKNRCRRSAGLRVRVRSSCVAARPAQVMPVISLPNCMRIWPSSTSTSPWPPNFDGFHWPSVLPSNIEIQGVSGRRRPGGVDQLDEPDVDVLPAGGLMAVDGQQVFARLERRAGGVVEPQRVVARWCSLFARRRAGR